MGLQIFKATVHIIGAGVKYQANIKIIIIILVLCMDKYSSTHVIFVRDHRR